MGQKIKHILKDVCFLLDRVQLLLINLNGQFFLHQYWQNRQAYNAIYAWIVNVAKKFGESSPKNLNKINCNFQKQFDPWRKSGDG